MSSKPRAAFSNTAETSLTCGELENALRQASDKLLFSEDSGFGETNILAIHFASCPPEKKIVEEELLITFREGYGFVTEIYEIDEGKGWRMTPVSTLFFRAATTCEEV
jgi:hypothetical protein